MEPFSHGAAIIGVTGFTVGTLMHSVKKLYTFWSAIKDAPDNVRAMTADLRLLLAVLSDLVTDAEQYEHEATWIDALEACMQRVSDMNDILLGNQAQ